MITLRPISPKDAASVVLWRNSKEARETFFWKEVVTPDSHFIFIRDRKPHDLVWMIDNGKLSVGMVSLTVNVKDHTAEFGRFYIDPKFRKQGVGREAAELVLHYGFNILRLKSIWLETPFDTGDAYRLYMKLGFVSTRLSSRGAYIMEICN